MDFFNMIALDGKSFSLTIGDDYWFYIDGERVRSISLVEKDTLELIVDDEELFVDAERFFDFLEMPNAAMAR